jgi:methionyl-tRNA formyltransferase
LVPWPGAFTLLPKGPEQAKASPPSPALLKLWQAELADASGAPGEILRADKSGLLVACGDKSVRLLQLQREGGRRLTAPQFLAGHPLRPGDRLG